MANHQKNRRTSFARSEVRNWFSGGTIQAAVASQFAYLQLLNPATNSLDLLVTRARFNSSGNPNVLAGFSVNTLGNLLTTWHSHEAGQNGATGVLRQATSTDTTFISSEFMFDRAQGGNNADLIIPDFPLLIVPGNSFMVRFTTINVEMTGMLTWAEIT